MEQCCPCFLPRSHHRQSFLAATIDSAAHATIKVEFFNEICRKPDHEPGTDKCFRGYGEGLDGPKSSKPPNARQSTP